MSPIFPAAAAFCHLLAFSASFFPSLAFSQTVFSYNGFDSADATTISLFQGSSFSDGKIQLTATGAIQGMGRSLFSHPIQLLDSSSGAPLSFSTQFIFSMQPGPEDLADGLAFVISPVLGGMPNSSQGLLGILSNDSNGNSSSHTFAVEFDAYKNPELQDIDGNHVGIDINNVVSWEAVSAAYKSSEVLESAADGYEVALKGQMIQAWIDYDGSTTQLNVSISPKLGVKPMFPLISNSSVNLSGILEDQMYVGFSASTGPLSDVLYYVYAWSFSNNGSSAPVSVPDRDEKTEKITMILGIVFGLFAGVLLLLAGLSFVLLRRRRKYSRGKKTEWQLDSLWVDHLPQKFSYSELSKATKGFHEHNLLGSGGFGSVYRGVLPSSGLAVAVKRISKESKQGVKEFVSEVSTIGRLRHRNLVPLLGWCEERGLMLVYELMPNGSLDKHLFSREEGNKLPWASRFNIVKGVAAALLYLHEECEQKIVHRDVKPSNVMLDAEMNARLGDFGLARLYSHDAIPETTNVAGTWGYLAPECFATRKASGKADVYSLGAVMVEATTGRKMTESREGDDDVSMVEWLWRLGVKGEMVKAMDWKLLAMASTENLEREKMETEMEMVLKLSLWCLQTDPMSRPPIRRIVQILAGDATLPVDFFSSASSIAIACMELRSNSDPSMLSSSSSSHFSSEALLNRSSRHDFSSHTTASSITNPPAIPPH